MRGESESGALDERTSYRDCAGWPRRFRPDHAQLVFHALNDFDGRPTLHERAGVHFLSAGPRVLLMADGRWIEAHATIRRPAEMLINGRHEAVAAPVIGYRELTPSEVADWFGWNHWYWRVEPDDVPHGQPCRAPKITRANGWPPELKKALETNEHINRLDDGRADSPNPLDLVTLDQIAATCRISKRQARRWYDDAKLPEPQVIGGGGRAHLWDWRVVRPALEELRSISLPDRHPSSIVSPNEKRK